jgi:hypothetical protein
MQLPKIDENYWLLSRLLMSVLAVLLRRLGTITKLKSASCFFATKFRRVTCKLRLEVTDIVGSCK